MMAELTQQYSHRLIELETSLFPEKLFSSKSFSRRVLCTQPAKSSHINCLWIQDYSLPSAKISLHREHTFHCPIFSSSSVCKKALFIILLNQKYVHIRKNCYLMQSAALRTERQSPQVESEDVMCKSSESTNSYILHSLGSEMKYQLWSCIHQHVADVFCTSWKQPLKYFKIQLK